MTDVPDARIAAWVCAWDNLRAAREFSVEHGRERPGVPLPEPYWAALAEAAVFAKLARADAAVGTASGELINQREAAQQLQKQLIDEFFGAPHKAEGAQR